MMRSSDLARWCAAAAEQYGDPSLPICQLFVRWQHVLAPPGDDIVIGMREGELTLQLGPLFPPLPLPVRLGEPELTESGELKTYGAERVTRDIWEIVPSLNVEGMVHAFLVLFDVPDPAPWERRIVLPT